MKANAMLKPSFEDLEALDRAYVFHPSTHLKNHAHGEAPCRIVRGGEGVYVIDRDGRESLDAFAGLYCVNAGYGRKEIADAVYRQMRELAYYHAYARGDVTPGAACCSILSCRSSGGRAQTSRASRPALPCGFGEASAPARPDPQEGRKNPSRIEARRPTCRTRIHAFHLALRS